MAGDLLPYLKFFPAETLADERFSGWDMAERGTWFTLILHAWKNGSIPSDEAQLARIAHMKPAAFRKVWAAISDRFIPHPEQAGRLTSRRLEMEREEAVAKSNAGKKGAASRWHKAATADVTTENDTPAAMRPHSDPDAAALPAAQRSAAQRSTAQPAGRIPSKAERQRQRYPLAVALLDLLADEMPDTSPAASEAQLAALDLEAQRRGGAAQLAAACVAFVAQERAGEAPRSVAFFASVLDDLPSDEQLTRPPEPPATPWVPPDQRPSLEIEN